MSSDCPAIVQEFGDSVTLGESLCSFIKDRYPLITYIMSFLCLPPHVSLPMSPLPMSPLLLMAPFSMFSSPYVSGLPVFPPITYVFAPHISVCLRIALVQCLSRYDEAVTSKGSFHIAVSGGSLPKFIKGTKFKVLQFNLQTGKSTNCCPYSLL